MVQADIDFVLALYERSFVSKNNKYRHGNKKQKALLSATTFWSRGVKQRKSVS